MNVSTANLRSFRVFCICCLGALTLAGLAPVSTVRAQLPGNWRELNAAEFAAAVIPALSATPPLAKDELQQVVEHAWATFLDDPDFIAQGDWITVLKLAEGFGNRAPANDAPARSETFRQRLAERLATQSPVVEGFAELSAVDRAMEAAGIDRKNLAPRAAAWMQVNDWRQLKLTEQIWLATLLQAEEVPVSSFSVRWTGTLKAPTTGSYVLAQMRQHHVDGNLRIMLDNAVILDSTTDATPLEDGSRLVQVQSQPIDLQAGEAHSFVVEYRYDAKTMLVNDEFAERIFPMAAVTWRVGENTPEVVPASVFQTPDGGQAGLLGEYFGGVDFVARIATRIDPGLQMIWSEKQVLSMFDAEQAQVVATCRDAILNGDALVQVDDGASFIENDLPKLLKRLPAADRQAILHEVTLLPELLEKISPYGVRAMFPHLFMLPGDEIVDFFAAWVDVRDVDVNKILPYPGWGPGTFNAFAYDDYGWVGHFLRGANWHVAQKLLDEHLRNPDGSCNLMVAYCVGMAAVEDRRPDDVLAILNEELTNGDLRGDPRATWLLARAYFKEVNAGGVPIPVLGLSDLEEASLVSESDAMGFRVTQEIVARIASFGQKERALELIDAAGERFPARAEELASWRIQAEQAILDRAELAERTSAEAAASNLATYLAEIRRRQQQAVSNGDDEAAQRYESEASLIEQQLSE